MSSSAETPETEREGRSSCFRKAAHQLFALLNPKSSVQRYSTREMQILPASPIENSLSDPEFSFFPFQHSQSETAPPLPPPSPHVFSVSPENLQLCLSFASSFPPEYEFRRDTMVQLWMAREFIHEEANQRIEDQGYYIFDLFVSRDLIVSDGYMRYKINESKIGEVYPSGSSSPADILILDEAKLKRFNFQTFRAPPNYTPVRILVLVADWKNPVRELPFNFLNTFPHLLTLDLSQTQISEVPYEIFNLKDLKYLDLSGTHISSLPSLLCCLENLQTLKLRGCSNLTSLPSCMMLMINLRHIDMDIVGKVSRMPECIGKLVNLQTLEGFILGDDDETGIQQLSQLNGITGTFYILMLQNVQSVKAAREADLRNKKYITKLEFHYGKCIDAVMEKQILEGFVPHPNLEELGIFSYHGFVLPDWISDPSFAKLTKIVLFNCNNCYAFPCIGNLPSLRILDIYGMEKLRAIKRLFRRDSPKHHSYFPKLEILKLENMSLLEEWSGIEDHDFPCLLNITISSCPKLCEFPLMFQKSLEYLYLYQCDGLQCLPRALPASLETLRIGDCPTLQERCLKDEGEDWVKIAHVPIIWMDFEKISGN